MRPSLILHGRTGIKAKGAGLGGGRRPQSILVTQTVSLRMSRCHFSQPASGFVPQNVEPDSLKPTTDSDPCPCNL